MNHLLNDYSSSLSLKGFFSLLTSTPFYRLASSVLQRVNLIPRRFILFQCTSVCKGCERGPANEHQQDCKRLQISWFRCLILLQPTKMKFCNQISHPILILRSELMLFERRRKQTQP